MLALTTRRVLSTLLAEPVLYRRLLSSSAAATASVVSSGTKPAEGEQQVVVKKKTSGGAINVVRYWNLIKQAPFGLGPYLFSYLVRYSAPYSASTDPRIRELRPGYCRGEMTESFWLKNPFNSIHALALGNLGELVSGLMLMDTMNTQGLRGIVTSLKTDFYAKAKGTVAAIAELDVTKPILTPEQMEGTFQVEAKIFDKSNTMVAKVTVYWNVRRA